MKKSKEKLNDDLQRSYTAEIKELTTGGGKLFTAYTVSRSRADLFPELKTMDTDGNASSLPPQGTTTRAMLVACLFRANAQGMVDSWTNLFADRFAGEDGVHVYQLSLVENTVMAMPGFRNILLAGGREQEKRAASRDPLRSGSGEETKNTRGAEISEPRLQVRVQFSFGDTYTMRQALRISNRLTAYVYIVDQEGKVRFLACGHPSEEELNTMVEVTQTILKETRPNLY